MGMIVFLVLAASPESEFRDWSTEDGILNARYCWIAYDWVVVEDEIGLHRHVEIATLSEEDRNYVQLRRQLAKREKPKIRIGETRKEFFKNDPGIRAYWAKTRLARRAQTSAKFNAMVANAQMARMMANPLMQAAALSRLYNGPPPNYMPGWQPSGRGWVRVRGYYRKDGTYVRSHTRRR